MLDYNDQEIDFKDLEYIYRNKHNSYDFTVHVPDTEYENLNFDEFKVHCQILKTIYDREKKD